jgi:hypothetical protein
MPPRTSYSSEEATRRHSEDEEGDDQAEASDRNSSTNDQCSYSSHHPAAYQGRFMDEKVGIQISKTEIDTSDDDNVMLTLSDEASVSSLEDSYVEGDSWSTIEDDEDISNHLILLTDIYSPEEADRVFIFTDEENSPPIVPSEPMDFSGLNSSLSNRASEVSFNSTDHDRRSESASAISDQWIPQKYMMWPRRNSLSLSGDSDDSYCSDTSSFLSKAVMSMRRRRRHRNSVPVTSLLNSVNASSNTFDIDDIPMDKVSSWEDDSNARESESLSVQKNIASLRVLLGEQDDTMRNSSSSLVRKNLSCGSESNRSLPIGRPFSVVEERKPTCLPVKRCVSNNQANCVVTEGYEQVGRCTKDPRHSKHLPSLISSTGEQLTLNLRESKHKVHGKNNLFFDSQYPMPGFEETESTSVHSADEEALVGLRDDSGTSKRETAHRLDRQNVGHRAIVANEDHCVSKIQRGKGHDAGLVRGRANRRRGEHEKESTSDNDCLIDSTHIHTGNNDTTKEKESPVLPPASNLEATHVIGWKRVRRNLKSRKRSSRGKSKSKPKRGNEEKPRPAWIQSNAVSLQSGTAPWSSDLIRSVTPISTAALDARPTSRSIAASLGLEEEADKLLAIFSEIIAQQARQNVSAKEVPKITCFRMTEDLYFPNFGMYVVRSVQHFKEKLFI